MREILFKGKRIDNREWVEGFYTLYGRSRGVHPAIITGTEKGCVIPAFVIPETVGQYTSLTDKNGKKIFEGDIVKDITTGRIYVVKWCEDCAMFVLPCVTDESLETNFTVYYGYELEIIGNIHDNPELLEEDE